MRYAVLIACLTLVVLVGGAEGCSGTPHTTTGTETDVSFTHDVMPILESSCSTSQAFTCHGDPVVETTMVNGMANQPRPYFGPYLGSSDPTADATLVYNELVNVPSKEAPSIVYVKPGNLDASFLDDKLVGGQRLTSIQAQCTTGADPACGLVMPNDNLPLTSAQLNAIESWLQGGAPLN
jgi:hypothetical protein